MSSTSLSTEIEAVVTKPRPSSFILFSLFLNSKCGSSQFPITDNLMLPTIKRITFKEAASTGLVLFVGIRQQFIYFLSSGLYTYVRQHFPQYCLSKWLAMKTPAPHSSLGHSLLNLVILPFSSTCRTINKKKNISKKGMNNTSKIFHAFTICSGLAD